MKESIEGNYRLVSKVGEGTYGVVFKAVDQRTGERVAIKKVKVRKPDDGLPKELIREIESMNALKRQHGDDFDKCYLVSISEVFLGKTSLNVVYTPYCPELDLSGLMVQQLGSDQVMQIAKQLLRAVAAVHESQLMHRDIKPANVLISDKGILLCDFGQTRVDLQQIQSEEAEKLKSSVNLTLEVGSRWYKSPEVLFGYKAYNQAIDLWALGCVIAELVISTIPMYEEPEQALSDNKTRSRMGQNTRGQKRCQQAAEKTYRSLFQGMSDIDQMVQITGLLGTPDSNNWPEIGSMPDNGKILFKETMAIALDDFIKDKFGPHDCDLLLYIASRMLVYSAEARLTAADALELLKDY